MWRRAVLLCLLIFNELTSSQPVTDDSENARQTRQLDFSECCPCPGSGQGFEAKESSMPSDGMFARSRDIDDCPCAPRSSDSEGASSIFFPTSRHPDDFTRRTDKKEDFKPLLHPEIDLVSSVLQTLREATEEEYEEALARDAARSVAKAAEETIFGDAVPEASNGNIVTIVVNPKHSDSFEDGIPQESHIQESRCMHAPLESENPNLGKIRLAHKPPNLLREIFGLPKINEPVELLHKNLLDMDNGASNIQEQTEHADDDQMTNKSGTGSSKYAEKVPDFKLPPLKKLKDLILSKPVLEGKEKSRFLPSLSKIRFNNTLLKLKGKDNEDLGLSASNIHEQAKKSFFQTKSHLENLLQNTKPIDLKNLLKLKDVEFVPLKDLIPKVSDRPTLKKPKLAWADIFNKGDNLESPINIARSTEIIETIPESGKCQSCDAEVSPSNIIEQINDENCLSEEFTTNETEGEDTNAKTALSDKIDAESSPEIQEIINNTSNDIQNCESNEVLDNTKHYEMKSLADVETNLPQSFESSSNIEPQSSSHIINEDESSSNEITADDTKEGKKLASEFISNDEDCISYTNVGDSITDSSNVIDVLKPIVDGLENIEDQSMNKTPEIQEPCSEELPEKDASKIIDTNAIKYIKPLSLDSTLSTIKENIRKHIENLKIPQPGPKKIYQPTINNIVENKKSSSIIEQLDPDCQNDESMQVTTVQPDNCNEDLKIEYEAKGDEVSMLDLQKISDEMLQKEQQRELKTTCNEPNQKVMEPKIPIEENIVENENVDSDLSANTQNELIMEPQSIVDINEKHDNDVKNTCKTDFDSQKLDSDLSANTQNELIMEPQSIVDINEKNDNDVKNTCKTDFDSQKQSFEQEQDANVEASEVVMSRTPQCSEVFSSPLLLNKVLQPNEKDFSLNIPLPDMQDIQLPTLDQIKLAPLPTLDEIKLAPLPTFNEIKLGLTNLFDTPARNVEEHSTLEAASMTDTSKILAPVMSTEASAKHFQSLLSPLRLEDVNLDILQLNPQPDFWSKIPTLDRHSFRPTLPLPTDLRIKPLNLKSVFEDNSGFLGTPLNLGQNNAWGIRSLDSLGSRMKANTNKIAKTLRKPETLKLKSSQGIGDLSNSKHSLKSMHHSLESKIRGATTKPVNLQSNDILEAISRNHEDVNDKLRALHIDFNDRLETMRNNLFDKSIFGSGESRSTKSFGTFSTKDKKSKLKTSLPQSLSSRKESNMKPQRQKETMIGSSHGLQNKFKMPTSASVPVPSTIEVPKLKATLTKSPGLGMQRASAVNPIFQNMEGSQPKESTINYWKQKQGYKKLPITNKRLGNPFKDSKIKVSFSTTPRTTLPSRLQSRKLSTPSLTSTLGKNTRRLGQRDHSGSPSEITHSIISPSISSHQDAQNHESYAMQSESRQTGALETKRLGGKANLEHPTLSKGFQSWPKLSESGFLSKVKDAVTARMPKVNSINGKTMSGSVIENTKVLDSNTDMSRSASTSVDVMETKTLKENVSYKCTMVCTKE